jgi:hypothetical protein
MTRVTSRLGRIAVAVSLGVGLWLASEHAPLDGSGAIVSTADARVGRPLTPMSYAGVARRTTRRAVAVGAAAGSAGAYYYRPGCVQVVNAYGQIVYQCP